MEEEKSNKKTILVVVGVFLFLALVGAIFADDAEENDEKNGQEDVSQVEETEDTLGDLQARAEEIKEDIIWTDAFDNCSWGEGSTSDAEDRWLLPCEERDMMVVAFEDEFTRDVWILEMEDSAEEVGFTAWYVKGDDYVVSAGTQGDANIAWDLLGTPDSVESFHD